MTRTTTESPSLADRLARAIERSFGFWLRPKPLPAPARVYRSDVQRVPRHRR